MIKPTIVNRMSLAACKTATKGFARSDQDGGTAEQEGEEDDLRKAAFRERRDGVVWHDPEREVGQVLADWSARVFLDMDRLAVNRRPIEAVAGANDIHHDQADG